MPSGHDRNESVHGFDLSDRTVRVR